MSDIEVSLQGVHSYWGNLREVREENLRHSQLATARENLKHIFTVPETVSRTEGWVEEGKLLQAHQSLIDLENSRDDLLFELHLITSYSSSIQQLSKQIYCSFPL